MSHPVAAARLLMVCAPHVFLDTTHHPGSHVVTAVVEGPDPANVGKRWLNGLYDAMSLCMDMTRNSSRARDWRDKIGVRVTNLHPLVLRAVVRVRRRVILGLP